MTERTLGEPADGGQLGQICNEATSIVRTITECFPEEETFKVGSSWQGKMEKGRGNSSCKVIVWKVQHKQRYKRPVELVSGEQGSKWLRMKLKR